MIALINYQAQGAIQSGAEWFITKPVLEKSVEWQLSALCVMTFFAFCTLIYAVVIAKRSASAWPIYVCVGATLSAFYEPLGDLFAHVTYHEVNQINFTSAFGYRIPIWLLPTYTAFFGATVLWIVSLIERGINLRRWMLLFLILTPGAWIFEVPLLRMGAISYYGDNQPLSILGYPVWMAFANSATMFVVSGAMYFLKDSAVVRKYPFLLVPVFPMLVVGVNATCALPLASAINSNASMFTINAMALLSMGLSAFYVWMCGKLIVGMRKDRQFAE